MVTHLHIPDPHAHPKYSNERFDILGKLILDVKPDVVICAGDLFDMDSLSSYESSTKKAYEKRTYIGDINAGVEAQDRLWFPIRKAKRKMPRRVFTMGNHEEPRITRLLDAEPHLQGHVSPSDMQLDKYWDDVVPFLQPVVVDGIAYCHYFVSGVMGRAISGMRPASQILKREHMSCTSGHTHTFDYAKEHTADGRVIMSLVNGCFVDYNTPWNNPQSNSMFHSGVAIKHNVENGNYDLEVVSMRRLKEAYGG